MNERLQEFLKNIPPEMRAIAEKICGQAEAYQKLIDKIHAEHVMLDLNGTPTGVVFSPEEVPEETKGQMQSNCPFPLRFVQGMKPAVVTVLVKKIEEVGLSPSLGIHKDDPRSFLVSVSTPDGEEIDGLREKLIEFVGKIFRADGYPKDWTILVNGEEIFNLKQSTFSDEDVEALRQKLESAQDVNDIINSL